MSQSEYDDFLLRSKVHSSRVGHHTPGDHADGGGPEETPEAHMHGKILEHCKRERWIAFHGSMVHRAMRTKGEPDFTILGPGFVLFIECKTQAGKLSQEQFLIHRQAEMLGHTIHVIRSFKAFLELCQRTLIRQTTSSALLLNGANTTEAPK